MAKREIPRLELVRRYINLRATSSVCMANASDRSLPFAPVRSNPSVREGAEKVCLRSWKRSGRNPARLRAILC
jgi:hypothetical protein